MDRDLEINIVRTGANSVVHLKGDVDLKTSPELRSTILDLLIKRGQERVVLDLKGVGYMDSSGIATLVEGLKEAKSRKARFILSGVGEGVRHVLDLTRLTSAFEIVKTADEVR